MFRPLFYAILVLSSLLSLTTAGAQSLPVGTSFYITTTQDDPIRQMVRVELYRVVVGPSGTPLARRVRAIFISKYVSSGVRYTFLGEGVAAMADPILIVFHYPTNSILYDSNGMCSFSPSTRIEAFEARTTSDRLLWTKQGNEIDEFRLVQREGVDCSLTSVPVLNAGVLTSQGILGELLGIQSIGSDRIAAFTRDALFVFHRPPHPRAIQLNYSLRPVYLIGRSIEDRGEGGDHLPHTISGLSELFASEHTIWITAVTTDHESFVLRVDPGTGAIIASKQISGDHQILGVDDRSGNLIVARRNSLAVLKLVSRELVLEMIPGFRDFLDPSVLERAGVPQYRGLSGLRRISVMVPQTVSSDRARISRDEFYAALDRYEMFDDYTGLRSHWGQSPWNGRIAVSRAIDVLGAVPMVRDVLRGVSETSMRRELSDFGLEVDKGVITAKTGMENEIIDLDEVSGFLERISALGPCQSALRASPR